jgi:hypothetical protein
MGFVYSTFTILPTDDLAPERAASTTHTYGPLKPMGHVAFCSLEIAEVLSFHQFALRIFQSIVCGGKETASFASLRSSGSRG